MGRCCRSPQPCARWRRMKPAGSSRSRIAISASVSATRGCVGSALHGERNQRAAALGRGQSLPVREGRHRQLHRARPARRGQSREAGHESRGPLPAHAGGRRVRGRFACASAISRREISKTRSANCAGTRLTSSSRRVSRRPTSSMRPSFPRRLTPTRPTSCGRRWPGCSGPSSSISMMWAGG